MIYGVYSTFVLTGLRVMSSEVRIVGFAPAGEPVTSYDRQQLALYAAMLDADGAGQDWREAAATLMRIDVTSPDGEACWLSHLERARWIVGGGLAAALQTFGARTV